MNDDYVTFPLNWSWAEIHDWLDLFGLECIWWELGNGCLLVHV